MTVERPLAAPRAAGRVDPVAWGAAGSHVFEVSGARFLSLEVTFSGDIVPDDGVVLPAVELHVGGGDQGLRIGRCRFEAPTSDGEPATLVPLDPPLDCRQLIRRGRTVPVQQTLDQLASLLVRKQAIRAEFRRYTADLVYDLRVHRMLLDEIDAGLACESAATRRDVQEAVLVGPGRSFMRFFDDRLCALEELVAPFSPEEHDQHAFYFRRQTWDIILASPFLARANIRPCGYAGDFVMMQYLYENAYLGESTFGKLMHKHPIESAAAQAVRNRRAMIADLLTAAHRDRPAGARSRLRFMSVACGPAWEVADLLVTAEDCDRYECTLLDHDKEALAATRGAVSAAEQRTGYLVRVRYICDSIRAMLRSNDPGSYGRHHVLYSMGLFDYLTAPVAKALLTMLYQLVEPNGRMAIGNFHVASPTRRYMDYWMNWPLIYRTEAEFLALAADLPGARCTLTFDQTGSQMFLLIHKSSS